MVNLLSVTAFTLLRCFNAHVRLTGVSIKATNVALKRGSSSCFSRCLSRVVCVFRGAKVQAMFFRSLSHFRSTRVFSSLHRLGRVLGGSPGLRQAGSAVRGVDQQLRFSHFMRRGGSRSDTPVRFMCTVRSTVFDGRCILTSRRIDGGRSLSRSFSHTGFFSLVVPMIPFISTDGSCRVTLRALRSIFSTGSPRVVGLLRLITSTIPSGHA